LARKEKGKKRTELPPREATRPDSAQEGEWGKERSPSGGKSFIKGGKKKTAGCGRQKIRRCLVAPGKRESNRKKGKEYQIIKRVSAQGKQVTGLVENPTERKKKEAAG